MTPRATALAAMVALALLGACGARAGERDPMPVLKPYYSPPARLVRQPAPGMGARVQRWLIITARGDTVRALWRAAGKKTVRPWTAVLLGGFHTGDRAALLVPDDTLFNMLAVKSLGAAAP
jgi:hypothetical protein